MTDKKKEDLIGAFMVGFCFCLLIILLGFAFGGFPIHLDQSTGNDICYNLTNNSLVVASSINGKLICEIPSYETESNIIIKNIGLEDNRK